MEHYRDYGSAGSNPPPPPQPGSGLPQNYETGYPPPYAPPPPEEMGTGKVVGLSALACCLPGIGPLISLIIGIIERAKKGAVVVIVISAVMLVLALPLTGMIAAIALPIFIANAPEEVQQEFEDLMGGPYMEIQDKSKEAEVKQNLHAISLGLERYAVDGDGNYPADITALQERNYFNEFPINPFSGQAMVSVQKSDSAEIREGNFTYIQSYTGEKVTGYLLVGYGSVATTESRFAEFEDGPAAAVITLSSGIDRSGTVQ